jgi:hypothetical protein
MFGKTTNSKKIERIIKKVFDEKIVKTNEDYNDFNSYYKNLRNVLFKELPPQIRVMWKSVEDIFLLRIDQLPIIDIIEFHFLNLINNLISEQIIYFSDKDFEDRFRKDLDVVNKSNDKNKVKEIIKKYRTIIDKHFKNGAKLNIYEMIERVEQDVNLKVDLLEKKVTNGAYDFIDKVDYLKLKNLILLHLILKSSVKRYLPDLKSMMEDGKKQIDKITDSKFLKVIKESNFPEIQSALVLEKNNIAPIQITKIFSSSQDDYFKLAQYNFKLTEIINTDIVLVYLKDSFDLKRMNKEKLAEILYSLMDVLFEFESDIEILTREEWRDYQEKKGCTPGEDNRAWRTYMIRQVEKYIPFFDHWVKSA